MDKQENNTITVEDLKKNPDWTDNIALDLQWFGTPDYGFKFMYIPTSSVVEWMGGPCCEDKAIHIEFARDMLPESIRQEMFNLFYDKMLSDHHFQIKRTVDLIKNVARFGPNESFLAFFNFTL